MYQQMRDMLSHEEREAQSEVDHELEIDQTKLCNLMKRLTENTAIMRKATEDINSLLSQSQTLSFLQVSGAGGKIKVELWWKKLVNKRIICIDQ